MTELQEGTGTDSRRPHVVIVLIGCAHRTIATNAVIRAEGLAKSFLVTVVSDAFPDVFPRNLARERVDLPDYRWLRRFSHVTKEVMFCIAVRRRIRSLVPPPDFLICHGHSAAFFVGRYFQKAGVPYALFMHGDIFDRPWGMYGPILTSFYRAVTPTAARDADLVIAQSPSQAGHARRHGSLKGKVAVIPNGIDPLSIGLLDGHGNERVTRFAAGDPVELLFVGHFSPEKGLDLLIDACGRLKGRGIDVRLTIVGPDPGNTGLRALVNKTRWPECFRLVGKIERRRLAEFFCTAHALCVPSRSEALANVVLEALVCGTPVVASDVGGNPFMVTHGVNGWLVAPDSAEVLALRLEEIVTNPSKLKVVASACVDSVKERFSWEVVAGKLAQEISAVLDRDGP